MKKPRKAALAWALGLFAEGKTQAEMEAAAEASGKEKEPRAYAVLWCWQTSREWVTAELTAGLNYEDVARKIEKLEGDDAALKPARTSALAAIKVEGHTTPQHDGAARPRRERAPAVPKRVADAAAFL